MLVNNAAGTLAKCRAFLVAPGTGEGARKIVNLASVGGGVEVFPRFSLSDGLSRRRWRI